MSNTADRTPSNALDLQQQLGRVLVNGLECKLIAKDELRAMAQRASALQVRECALAGLEASGPLSNQTLAKFERALGALVIAELRDGRTQQETRGR
jgi:hypothetical protein